MIDRKTFLVAQREFMENVRTKTFWIGWTPTIAPNQ